MIADYEAVLDQITMRLTPATHAMAVELALQGLDIKGFGHVKRSTYESVKAKRGQLLVSMRELSCREVMTENSMTDAQRLRSEPCREVA
jgi:indolepyruvate ferredoxin oxidoreductase